MVSSTPNSLDVSVIVDHHENLNAQDYSFTSLSIFLSDWCTIFILKKKKVAIGSCPGNGKRGEAFVSTRATSHFLDALPGLEDVVFLSRVWFSILFLSPHNSDLSAF
jgi:hypothetical protein